MKHIEAMKLALEALEFDSHYGTGKQKAITALQEALAEQPAPSQYGSPELQAMIVARAMEKNAAEKPAQQEPVAWIEHEWSGTGLRHLHFEKREPAVRDEVVNPIWTPLYTSPPTSNQCKFPLCQNEDYQQALAEQLKQELYTGEPAQRKPLTGEEMNQIEARWDASMHGSKIAFVVRETEAAHGIKENT